jgi:hypothetical protein
MCANSRIDAIVVLIACRSTDFLPANALLAAVGADRRKIRPVGIDQAATGAA